MGSTARLSLGTCAAVVLLSWAMALPVHGQTETPAQCVAAACAVPDGVYIPSTTIRPPPGPVDVVASSPPFVQPGGDNRPFGVTSERSLTPRLLLLLGGGIVLVIRFLSRHDEAKAAWFAGGVRRDADR